MSDWRALKHFCSELPQYGLNVPASDYIHRGTRFIRTSDINDRGQVSQTEPVYVEDSIIGPEHRLIEGDLLLSRSGTLGRCLRYQSTLGHATFAGYLIRFRPNTQSEARFLEYCTQSSFFQQQIDAQAPSSTISNFNAERYANLRMPWWPPDRQRAIADYLDTETSRIDTLITKKRRMIELLGERWEAWLRKVLRSSTGPVLPLKRKWRVIDCKHRTPTYVDDGYPVMSPGDITPGRLDLTRAHRFVGGSDFKDLAGGTRRPRKRDIIYSRNASIGIASYVDTSEPFTMGQDVCLITSDDMDQLYLMYVLNSIGVDQLEVQKVGSTFSRVNIAQILELDIPVPDRESQRSLSRRFDRSALRLSRACNLLNQQIDLLAERRQALITSAVTGEFAVPADSG